jgi:putative colanic acid biosynthesis acetyltransferase WcaF
VNLSRFTTGAFDRGASRVKEVLWVLVRFTFFASAFPWPSRLRCILLRLFGATVGRGVVIRSRVNIWMPWRLTLGDHVWLGEEVFILNLAPVRVASNVCISQRAFLCTGNHDYSKTTFDLITQPITVESGAWIGACSFVGPGVTVKQNTVLTAGSVATQDLEANGIYRGNPAQFVKERRLS